MADDIQSIVDSIRAARGRGVGVPPGAPPVASRLDPSPDQSRSFTADILRDMGYDEGTIQSVVPGALSVSEVAPSFDDLNAATEVEAVVGDAEADGPPVPTDTREKVKYYLDQFGDDAVAGLAGAQRTWNKISEHAGRNAAKALTTGKTSVNLGMAALDIFTRLDNQLKIDLFAPDEKKAALKLKYLPKAHLLDPKAGDREFGTATEMALWAMGQKMWGAANELAAVPPELAGKLAGSLGFAEASAYLADLASRDKATGKAAGDLVTGQIPSMVAGMAPYVQYQEIFESHFDPKDLEDIYAQIGDPGNHGWLTAASMVGLGTVLDAYASPLVILSMAPAGLIEMTPKVMRAVNPAKAAEITSEIAKGTNRYGDALEAVKAATANTAKAASNIQKTQEQGKPVTAPMVKRYLLAEEAQAREEHWLSQFSDPGRYEPVLLRPSARNPKTVPDAAPNSAARKAALSRPADMPVDWSDPHQVDLPLKQQRVMMGPSDAEYAGDALNLLTRGAEIDDITMSRKLEPEYYVLPDVVTSLQDMRKVEKQNAFARAEAQAGYFGPTPGEVVTPARMLGQQEADVRVAIGAAKRAGQADKAAYYRNRLKQIKGIRERLATELGNEYDAKWLPEVPKGIMEDPGRFNRWLEVAGNRVARSLYPGGLMLHGWSTKLGQVGGMSREPMRYYMSYDPAAWERIRSVVMRQDQSLAASTNMLAREAEAAGILVKRGDFNLAKHFSPMRVDEKRSEQLFDMLNVVAGTEEHTALYDAAAPEMRRMHDRVRVILDHFADMQQISGTEKYLQGYMRHAFDISVFDNGARPMEFIGLPSGAEVFASHLMERTGAVGYKKDAIMALDMYMRAAYRKLYMEPLFDDILETGKELAKKHGNRAHITYASDLVQQLKGKPTFVGTKIDDMIGGAWNSGGGVKVPFMDKKILYKPGSIDRAALGIYSLIHNGLTTGPHYGILQIASGLMTTASRLGPFDTMRGVFAMTTKEGQQLAKASLTYRPFVDFLESPELRKFTEWFQTRMKLPPLMISNQQAEEVSRGITYNASMAMYLRKAGFKNIREASEAGYLKRIMFESVRTSEEANHLYGPLGRSPWVTRLFGTAGATGAQQFLSYIPKQSEELLGQVARNPGYLLQYMAFSGQLTRMMANAGIDMTEDVGLGYLPQSPTDITSPAVDAAMSNLQLLDALSNGDAEGVEKAVTALTKSLIAIVPGGQVIMSGSKAVQRAKEGVVRTGSGDVLYRMHAVPEAGSGFGSEVIPTLTMQRNIHETLVRRGLQAASDERKRFGYNLRTAVDNYVDAEESGDTEAAAKLAEELAQVYKVRFTSTSPIARAMEARTVSKVLRDFEGNPQLQDVYIKIFQEHGIGVEP